MISPPIPQLLKNSFPKQYLWGSNWPADVKFPSCFNAWSLPYLNHWASWDLGYPWRAKTCVFSSSQKHLQDLSLCYGAKMGQFRPNSSKFKQGWILIRKIWNCPLWFLGVLKLFAKVLEFLSVTSAKLSITRQKNETFQLHSEAVCPSSSQ